MSHSQQNSTDFDITYHKGCEHSPDPPPGPPPPKKLWKWSGPFSDGPTTLGVYIENPGWTWTAGSHTQPGVSIFHLTVFPTKDAPDPAASTLGRLPSFLDRCRTGDGGVVGRVAANQWARLSQALRETAVSPIASLDRAFARAEFQDLVTADYARHVESSLRKHTGTLKKGQKLVEVKGLTRVEMDVTSRLCICETAPLYLTETTPQIPLAGSSGLYEAINLQGAPTITQQEPQTPHLFLMQGPRSDSVPTLAFTLRVEYSEYPPQDSLVEVRPEFAFCRGRDDGSSGQGDETYTVAEILESLGISEGTWASEFRTLCEKKWTETDPKTKRRCLQNNGQYRDKFETSLGLAVSELARKTFSSMYGTSKPQACRYLRPKTYDRMGSGKEFHYHSMFPFSKLQEGYLPNRKADKNKKYPESMRNK